MTFELYHAVFCTTLRQILAQRCTGLAAAELAIVAKKVQATEPLLQVQLFLLQGRVIKL